MDEKAILEKTFFGKVGIYYTSYVKEIGAALARGTKDVSIEVNANGHKLIVPDRKSTYLLKQKLEKENTETTALREILTKAKVSTNAIIPIDVFEKLLSQAGYFIFYGINSGNTVLGDSEKLDKFISKKKSSEKDLLSWLLPIVGFLISALITFVVYKTTRLNLGWWGWSRWIPVIICAVAGLIMSEGPDDSSMFIAFIAGVASYAAPPSLVLVPLGMFIASKIPFSGVTQTDAKNALWSERTDRNIKDGKDCELSIPSTSNEHIRILMSRCQAAGVPLSTSLHAYSFTIAHQDVMLSNSENEHARYGLVIATRYGSMVAILGQTGEFPLSDTEGSESIQQHFSEYSKGLVESAILYDEKLVTA